METISIYDFSIFLGSSYLKTIFLFSLICGSLYLLFWVIGKKKFERYRVLKDLKGRPLPLKEASLTFANLALYLIPIGLYSIAEKTIGFRMRYDSFFEYGSLYPFLSLFLMVFMVDTNFYWIHRWMHEKRIKAHFSHHVFVNPTPWAAYGVHFLEGFLLSLPYYLILFFIPWHPLTLLGLSIFAFFYNSFIHLGFDPLPKSWRRNWITKWFNTPTHHSLHHYKPNSNYGLYFTLWDKLMGTEDIKMN